MTAEDRIRATIMEQERARARQDAAAASEVIDLAELAAMTKPIREQLGWARHEVVQLIDARNNAATKEERGDARHRLPAARARRDLYKAILSDVQAVIESEGGTVLSPFAREFLETQVEVKDVTPVADSCRTVDVDGAAVRVHGSVEMTEQAREYFTQVVRAAIAKAGADEIGGVK